MPCAASISALRLRGSSRPAITRISASSTSAKIACLGRRRRTQDGTLALTSYLRWQLAPRWEAHIGTQLNGGGETSVNDVPQNDAVRNTRLMVGARYLIDHDTAVSLRYGADTGIENGFRLAREWQFRIGRRF